jgi:WD40 repeat protein
VEWEVPLVDAKKDLTAKQFEQLLEKERRRRVPLAFSADGKWVVAGQSMEFDKPKEKIRQGIVSFYMADSGKLKAQITTGDEVSSLAVSPDQRRLVTGHGGAIQVRDVEKGDLIRTLTGPAGHKGDVFWMQFINADQFLSAGQDKFVKLWNVQNGGLIRNFQFQGDQLTAAAVTPDGKTVALAGQRTRDGNREMALELRDVANGRLLNRLALPRLVPVRCVAFSPDGALVAVSAGDAPLQLWTVAGLLRGTGPPFEKP